VWPNLFGKGEKFRKENDGESNRRIQNHSEFFAYYKIYLYIYIYSGTDISKKCRPSIYKIYFKLMLTYNAE
jgi:hypothetical protein